MGKRGPAKTPTSILKQRGSRRAESRSSEPDPLPGAPKPPPGTRKRIVKIWDYLLEEVIPPGVVTKSDAVVFAELCELYDEIQELRKKLRSKGRTLETSTGGEKGNPLATQLDKASNRFDRLAARFGMDPSSRASLNISGEILNQKTSQRKKKLSDLISGRGSSN